jgi:hypothetical protein
LTTSIPFWNLPPCSPFKRTADGSFVVMCKADASMHVSLNPEQNFAHFGRTCGPIKSHFHIICAAPPRAQRRADFGVPVSLLTQHDCGAASLSRGPHSRHETLGRPFWSTTLRFGFGPCFLRNITVSQRSALVKVSEVPTGKTPVPYFTTRPRFISSLVGSLPSTIGFRRFGKIKKRGSYYSADPEGLRSDHLPYLAS